MNTESGPEHTTDWYVDRFHDEAERFAAVLDTGQLSAPVAACEGWDVGRLAQHLGQIHRWANFCIAESRPPSKDETAALRTFDRGRAAEWYRECAAELESSLRAVEPDAPTWHPFPVDQVAAVWPRRQAHETCVHRWDAERAIGDPGPIDPELAGDGIDEYFEIAVPRLIAREGIAAPTSSFHVHCTDVDGEWLVWTEDGDYRMKRAHEKGDAALRGPAEAILLRLWGRESPRVGELSPVGDESALAAWLAIGGM